MDSIPQELIDAIIDNIPHSSLPSCSLVAKRWRRKSQQRVLQCHLVLIRRPSESLVQTHPTGLGWHLILRSPPQKSAYLRDWAKPVLFSRMLGTLSSLTALSMYATEIPDELPGHISRGEFGKGITALYLFPTSARLRR
jgi:hypothetical protein